MWNLQATVSIPPISFQWHTFRSENRIYGYVAHDADPDSDTGLPMYSFATAPAEDIGRQHRGAVTDRPVFALRFALL